MIKSNSIDYYHYPPLEDKVNREIIKKLRNSRVIHKFYNNEKDPEREAESEENEDDPLEPVKNLKKGAKSNKGIKRVKISMNVNKENKSNEAIKNVEDIFNHDEEKKGDVENMSEIGTNLNHEQDVQKSYQIITRKMATQTWNNEPAQARNVDNEPKTKKPKLKE